MSARVMVLDDDEVTRNSLVELLTGYGYEAFALGTGEEALRAAENDRYEIALVDLKMPGMDGIEVLRRLKAMSPSIQVIVITAFATVETAVEAMKLGAFDYIMKPFKGEVLDATIRGSMEETEFERDLLERGGRAATRSPLEMFIDELGDRRGMVITGEDPEVLASEQGFQGAEVHRLASDGDAEHRVDPRDLDRIGRLIETFARSHTRSVVLVHGVEVLVEANGTERVTEFLRDLIQACDAMDSILLVSATQGTLEGSTLIQMEDLCQREYAQEMSESLANPTRRAVVQYLSLVGTSSFTDILSNVPEKESPKLSFHLKKLVLFGVISKDDKGKYHLTERGESLVRVLRDLDGEGMRESKTFFMVDFEGP